MKLSSFHRLVVLMAVDEVVRVAGASLEEMSASVQLALTTSGVFRTATSEVSLSGNSKFW